MKNRNVVCFLNFSLLAACGYQNEQKANSNENYSSWKREAPVKINHELSGAEVEKKDSFNTSNRVTEEQDNPKINKGEWGEKYGKSSFLYSASIDNTVEQKNKTITTYNFQSDGWVSTINVLGEKFLSRLPAKELLYYCLAYPAYYSQNCTAFPIPDDGETYFAQFLPVEEHISAVQTHCLQLKRDSVCLLLEKLFQENDTIHIETLDLIHRANLVEMIPLLCEKASFKKNPYVYTLFINMMNSNLYTRFTQSKYYGHLLRHIDPRGALIAKKADADSIIYYTMQFYEGYRKNTTP